MQQETDAPFSQKAKYLTSSAFVILWPHSAGWKFYGICFERYLCVCYNFQSSFSGWLFVYFCHNISQSWLRWLKFVSAVWGTAALGSAKINCTDYRKVTPVSDWFMLLLYPGPSVLGGWPFLSVWVKKLQNQFYPVCERWNDRLTKSLCVNGSACQQFSFWAVEVWNNRSAHYSDLQ